VNAPAGRGAAGIAAAAAVIGASFRNPPVHGIVTVPGRHGAAVALGAELVIAFVLMTAVLEAASHRAVAPFTGIVAGLLLALFVLAEQPVSGASANPARTLGAAVSAADWHALWIYVVAPPLGMLAAAEAHVRLGRRRVPCAKLNDDHRRCIFACDRHGGRPTH
jgi:aquaporin Z